MAKNEVIDFDSLDDNAQSLTTFITERLAEISQDSRDVVYIVLPSGERIVSATFECETLSDGSKVYNLILQPWG